MSTLIENPNYSFQQNISAHVIPFRDLARKTLKNSRLDLPTILARWNTVRKVQMEEWISQTQSWVRHPLARACVVAFAGTEKSNIRTLGAFIENSTLTHGGTKPDGFEKRLKKFSDVFVDKLRAENRERSGLTGITLLTALEVLAQTLNYWLAGQRLDTLDGAPISVTNEVLDYFLRMTAQEMQMGYFISDTVIREAFKHVSELFEIICS